MFPFLPLAMVALMILFALGLLALVVAVAMIKNRPGIAAFVGGLLLLGLLIPAGLVASYVSVRSDGPFDFHPIDTARHVTWTEGTKHATWRVSFVGILLIIGGVVALVAALTPRATSEGQEPRRRRWWPALVIVPLLMMFFLGTARVRKSTPYSHEPSDRHRIIVFDATKRQQEEIARRTAQMSAELERRINEMDIHELMDRFDAPQIVISTPPPAAIPWLALARLAAAIEAKSNQAITRTATWGENAAAAGTIESAAAGNEAEAQLSAEAEAAVELLATEEATDSTSVNITDKKSKPTTEPVAAVADAERANQPEDTLSTSINAAPARAVTTTTQAEAEETISAFDSSAAVGASYVVPDPNRPNWVDDPPNRTGDKWRQVIESDEFVTVDECYEQTDKKLVKATVDHIEHIANRENLVPIDVEPLEKMGIGLDFIRHEIATDEYVETVQRSFGPMKKMYTQIEFSPAIDHQLRQRWDAYQREVRFAIVGAGAGSILGILGFTYGLLKIDTWTKGYYTKRLFLGVPAAIIGLISLFAAMAKM